jgi:AcrR family transcriptional regulator
MTTEAPIADPLKLRRVPQQARSRARIEGILDAAADLVASEGAEALSTTRIADRAGISVGSLYQYFPDKGAIVDALARRYLDEFEALMDELAEAPDSGDLVGALIDAFADRYRAEPGYRALWFGRHLSDELREADRQNKLALGEGVRKLLIRRGLARDGAALRNICRAAVLTADALLQEAFRADPRGERALLDEAKRILRSYLAEVAGSGTGNRKGRMR